ncbi:MAG TPA: class I SAM-dependent methyltransferase [Dehalococcoidia bacterium]|nr:class I SAM-dependent methyltransferase [Dehalococcoidia bacterium]
MSTAEEELRLKYQFCEKYPVKPSPRYGHGKPPHSGLYEIINRNRPAYQRTLESFLKFRGYFQDIVLDTPIESLEPCWFNYWLSAFDSASLYSMLSLHNPERYFEIGSGWSTKFARRAIYDHGLQTKIVSIDPYPRADIDILCDTVIRKPLEEVDLSLFDELASGDILFVDGSHHCCMNSDVTVVFLDILPRLKSGVLVQFHDIYLPNDYPEEWGSYYSEQYLLAACILADGNKFDIVLPNAFITHDTELSSILTPLWDATNTRELTEGLSFWIRMK